MTTRPCCRASSRRSLPQCRALAFFSRSLWCRLSSLMALLCLPPPACGSSRSRAWLAVLCGLALDPSNDINPKPLAILRTEAYLGPGEVRALGHNICHVTALQIKHIGNFRCVDIRATRQCFGSVRDTWRRGWRWRMSGFSPPAQAAQHSFCIGALLINPIRDVFDMGKPVVSVLPNRNAQGLVMNHVLRGSEVDPAQRGDFLQRHDRTVHKQQQGE